MKFGEKIEKNQVIRVVLILSIIVTSILTIVIMVNNRKLFDNDKVYGDFSGEIRFDEPAGETYKLNVTFDGKRSFDGIIEINEESYEISSSYSCITTTLEFSFNVDEVNYFFSCEATINDSGTIIQGTVRYYQTSDQIYNGTVFLSKYF